ncbi:MAG: STAS domain-containing protein [Giesbergeria sp.]
MSAVSEALALPRELTLRQAGSTLVQLLADLAAQPSGAPVAVQAQAMEVFDSSALAVLLECRRAALANGCAFTVQGLPPALRGLAALYGVDGLLAES